MAYIRDFKTKNSQQMIKYFVLLFIFLSLKILSQEKCINEKRYLLENEASYESEINKNYQKAIDKYLVIQKNYHVDYWNYTIAKLYLQLNKKKKGIQFLEKALINGSEITDFDKETYSYLSKKDSISLVQKAPKLRGKFFSKIDYDLYQKVYYWYNPDQYFAKENVWGGRKEQHPIRKSIFKNNLSALREYIEKENKGHMPQSSQLKNALIPIKVMLLHHTREDSIDTVNYNFFEKKLKEEICTGNSYSPVNYAQFVDNMQLIMERGEKQVYGYFINWKTKQIYPLKHPEKVDSLRASIGLIDLKSYAKMRNVKLPENYPNPSE